MWGWLVLEALISIPFVLFGSLVLGLPGALGGILAGSIVLAVAAAFAETGLLHALKAQKSNSSTLLFTLERAVDSLGPDRQGKRLPGLAVFAHPVSQIFLAKSSSPGVIICSEGLLRLSSEDKIRDLLRKKVLELDRPESVLATLCAWILFRSDPCDLRRIGPRRPLDFLISLACFPWLRIVTAVQAGAVGKSRTTAALRKIDSGAPTGLSIS